MNEYETFKKWVNSFDVKIYYKAKPPTKKELYEIAIKQEEEIERLKEENTILKQTMSNNSLLINENAFLKERIDKAIEFIENCHGMYRNTIGDIQPMINIKPVLDILKEGEKSEYH